MSALLRLPHTLTETIFADLDAGRTGGTFSVEGKSVPTNGYFVGGVVPSLINPTRDQVESFIETAGADYVGYWEDSNDFALYVDAVDWVPTESAARRLADLRGEIAYWDVKGDKEVRVRSEYAGYWS